MAQVGSIYEEDKTGGRKSRWTVPSKMKNFISFQPSYEESGRRITSAAPQHLQTVKITVRLLGKLIQGGLGDVVDQHAGKGADPVHTRHVHNVPLSTEKNYWRHSPCLRSNYKTVFQIRIRFTVYGSLELV